MESFPFWLLVQIDPKLYKVERSSWMYITLWCVSSLHPVSLPFNAWEIFQLEEKFLVLWLLATGAAETWVWLEWRGCVAARGFFPTLWHLVTLCKCWAPLYCVERGRNHLTDLAPEIVMWQPCNKPLHIKNVNLLPFPTSVMHIYWLGLLTFLLSCLLNPWVF